MEHFDAQMAKGVYFVVCTTHKTSHVCGDLSKWLAPGTVDTMTCFCVPRRRNATTFLMPVSSGVTEVPVPGTLHKFGLKYFPLEKTRPTVNLLRKWFHTSLMQMTAPHASLLEVMLRVDGHSAAVSLKHYVLRDHRADAKLAEILVMAVLGPTVPWPAHMELDPVSAVSKGYTNTPWKDTMLHDTLPREIADEDDEMELDSWDGAGVFGIKHAVTPILDAEASDLYSAGPTAPESTRNKWRYNFDGTIPPVTIPIHILCRSSLLCICAS